MAAILSWGTNFSGLEDLIGIGDEAQLRLFTEGESWKLTPLTNKLQCRAEMVQDLGIELLLPTEEGELDTAIAAAGLDLGEVELVLTGEDRFLKQRATLFRRGLSEIAPETSILGEGAGRPRALMNSRTGFTLELAFVLAEEREPEPGRPHRRGTKLYSAVFEVKPYAEPDGLNPVELSTEVIQKFNLSVRTQVFVEVREPLLESENVGDALVIHVDAKLLKGIKSRRKGLEYDYMTANLAISAFQQVVFELSKELQEEGGTALAEDLPPVLAMVVAKLQEVKRSGAKTLTMDQAITMVEDQPEVAAALLTGLFDLTPDARKLINDSEGSDGKDG